MPDDTKVLVLFDGVCNFCNDAVLWMIDRDPQERNDLASDPGYQGLIRDCLADLRRVVDPDAVDHRARADQETRIAQFGGRQAILARGSFGYSPIPGDKPVYG